MKKGRKPLQVILADDHHVVRAGIRSIVEGSGACIIAETDDCEEAIHLVLAQQPDIVLMDIQFPHGSGIDATRRILSAAPHIKVLILSMHDGEHFVTGALEAGASGYLLKSVLAHELVAALHAVAKGECYLSSGITRPLVERALRTPKRPPEALTAMQRQIVALSGQGIHMKEIGDRLKRHPKTIARQLRQIMDKLGLRNPADLLRYAMREGLVPPEQPRREKGF